MSLYNDLRDVLAPYADKIKEIDHHVGELLVLTPQERKAFVNLLNNAVYTSDQGQPGGNLEIIRRGLLTPDDVQAIHFEKGAMYLAIGQTKIQNPIIEPDSALNRSVNWSSSDTEKATIDNNGNVTGVANGQSTITAITVDGGYKASYIIKIIEDEASAWEYNVDYDLFFNKYYSLSETTGISTYNATGTTMDTTDFVPCKGANTIHVISGAGGGLAFYSDNESESSFIGQGPSNNGYHAVLPGSKYFKFDKLHSTPDSTVRAYPYDFPKPTVESCEYNKTYLARGVSTGQSSSYDLTELVYCYGMDKINFLASSRRYIHFFNSGKTKIADSGTSNFSEYTIPQGAYYVRWTFPRGSIASTNTRSATFFKFTEAT